MPIIENTPFEKDLEERMNATMREYPGSTAILVKMWFFTHTLSQLVKFKFGFYRFMSQVRRHGLYVWGETWQKAKTQ